jgi:UDP-glucose 4-epimerase
VEEEIELTRGQPIDDATRQPRVRYRLLEERPAGDDGTSFLFLASIRVEDADSFERRWLVTVGGNEARFMFVWDEDVVACIVKGIHERRSGIYNLAGDGALTMREIARITGARCMPVPSPLLKTALAVLKRLRLTTAGPEQVTFLRYRPVLANTALKRDFGFTPTRTSRDAFEAYWKSRGS